MKATTINTIACLLPKDKRGSYHKNEIYTIQQRTVENGQELFATVDNKDLQWKFDRVVEDTALLRNECSSLTKSVIEGYNAAHFSLSVSDGHRRVMNEQREQLLKIIFEEFNLTIGKSTESFTIDYALLGLQDGGCYDIRKRVDRPNKMMEERGIDDIMKSVDNVEKIHTLMIDRELEIPHVLFIKLTNTRTNAIGRFSIIDLMYSPFSNTVRDGTLTSIQNIISALSTPKYTGIMPLGNSFLAKEITRYICGHNELLMTLYLNEKIMNETQSRDTKFLLTLVSSFTGMIVRSNPNNNRSNDPQLKRLESEVKSLSKQRTKLEKFHKHLISRVEKGNAILKKFEKIKNEREIIVPQTKAEEKDALYLDRMVKYKEEEIKYLETKLASNETIHQYDILLYKTEYVKLDTLFHLQEFSEEDISEELRTVEAMYDEPTSQLEQLYRAVEIKINKLKLEEKELQEKIKARSNELKTEEEELQAVEMTTPPVLETRDDPMDGVEEIEQTQKQPEEAESSEEEEVEEVEEPEDESLELELESLSKEMDAMNGKIKENGRAEFREKDHYKEELDKKRQVIKEFEKQHKSDLSSLKSRANEKMIKLHEKLEAKYADQMEHIEYMMGVIAEAKEKNNSDNDFESDSVSKKAKPTRKRRKIRSKKDDDED